MATTWDEACVRLADEVNAKAENGFDPWNKAPAINTLSGIRASAEVIKATADELFNNAGEVSLYMADRLEGVKLELAMQAATWVLGTAAEYCRKVVQFQQGKLTEEN